MTIKILHTPTGIVEVNPATVTDEELAELGLTREWADEELYFEAREQECNDIHPAARQAYDSWDVLTLAQKDKVLKGLLCDWLTREKDFYLSQP